MAEPPSPDRNGGEADDAPAQGDEVAAARATTDPAARSAAAPADPDRPTGDSDARADESEAVDADAPAGAGDARQSFAHHDAATPFHENAALLDGDAALFDGDAARSVDDDDAPFDEDAARSLDDDAAPFDDDNAFADGDAVLFDDYDAARSSDHHAVPFADQDAAASADHDVAASPLDDAASEPLFGNAPGRLFTNAPAASPDDAPAAPPDADAAPSPDDDAPAPSSDHVPAPLFANVSAGRLFGSAAAPSPNEDVPAPSPDDDAPEPSPDDDVPAPSPDDDALAPRPDDATPVPASALTPATAVGALHRVRAREAALVVVLALLAYVPFLGSYGLWDPWETHYGEVARRMLEDRDYVRLTWQDESFRSKPVLTFWLMAAGMKLFGVADDGGFSGELISTSLVEWSLRLPFALFGVAGLAMLWYALARLYSRRAAWLATLILGTSPLYAMISRQAITDMPSCALLVASMALFALAIFDDDRPLRRWRGLTTSHLFLAVFALAVVPQLAYYHQEVANARLVLAPGRFIAGRLVLLPFAMAFAGVAIWIALTTRTKRQVYLYWFYLLNGIAVLAKGPVAPALAGLTILGYLVLTNEWRLLKRCEIPRGVLVALLVALPWHLAIYLLDGNAWLNEYISTHLLGRAFKGVHGDRGTFQYFLGQLGVGMWPWACLVPGALAWCALGGRPRTREEKLRLLFAIWGISAFAFFTFVQTKFHHYILPAIPGLAVVAALWLDDVRAGRVPAVGVAVAAALALFTFTSIDLVARQEKLVHLFIYRYDRPWPYAAPWKLDMSGWILLFALAFAIALAALAVARLRRAAVWGLAAVSVAFTLFAIDVLMLAASPHWGQRRLHEIYYQRRAIHGVNLTYTGALELIDDWSSGKDLVVRSVIPQTLKLAAPMKVTWQLRGPGDQIDAGGELAGKVSSIDPEGHRFTIAVPAEERAKLAPVIEKERPGARSGRRWLTVDADRLIAWQLHWRGENFYSGGEIWNPRLPDRRTVFIDLDNTKFLNYLRPRVGSGERVWVVTEIGRLSNLRNILPSKTAQETFETPDQSNNKFGLATFVLGP